MSSTDCLADPVAEVLIDSGEDGHLSLLDLFALHAAKVTRDLLTFSAQCLRAGAANARYQRSALWQHRRRHGATDREAAQSRLRAMMSEALEGD